MDKQFLETSLLEEQDIKLATSALELFRDQKILQAWINQIAYYRTHIDVFIEEYMGFKLADFQKVIVRNIGNTIDSDIVATRSMGKTLIVAAVAAAIAILYPGSKIIVASKSKDQEAKRPRV